MNQIHVFVKEVEVSAVAGLHHALAGQLQSLGDVARDHGKSRGHRHAELADQALDFLEVAGNAAHAQADHFALVVEARHGTVSVGTHRDVVGCHSGFQYRLHAVSRRTDRAGAARGDVDVAAGKTEFDGALEDIGVTRAVRRTDVLVPFF